MMFNNIQSDPLKSVLSNPMMFNDPQSYHPMIALGHIWDPTILLQGRGWLQFLHLCFVF